MGSELLKLRKDDCKIAQLCWKLYCMLNSVSGTWARDTLATCVPDAAAVMEGMSLHLRGCDQRLIAYIVPMVLDTRLPQPFSIVARNYGTPEFLAAVKSFLLL